MLLFFPLETAKITIVEVSVPGAATLVGTSAWCTGSFLTLTVQYVCLLVCMSLVIQGLGSVV